MSEISENPNSKIELADKSENILESLDQYRTGNYTQLLQLFRDDRDDYYDRIYPQLRSDRQLVNRIINFIRGNVDEGIKKFFQEFNLNPQTLIKNAQDEDEALDEILDYTNKLRSYKKAIEQHNPSDTEFNGFGEDQDFSEIEEFIASSFSEDILRRCLISEILYSEDTVNIQINGEDFYVPTSVYSALLSSSFEMKKFRAENFTRWNTNPDFSKKYIPTPIFVYSFYGENTDDFSYLSTLSPEDRMKAYKLGTVAHEIAHHIYAYILQRNGNLLKEWQNLIDESGPLTDYARKYVNKADLEYEENFAEAIRLRTTAPDFLAENYSAINRFLIDNFPEVKPSK